jgi:hypothetical protein
MRPERPGAGTGVGWAGEAAARLVRRVIQQERCLEQVATTCADADGPRPGREGAPSFGAHRRSAAGGERGAVAASWRAAWCISEDVTD